MAIKQPKTMSVTEFKSKLGSIANEIGDQPIVVENHGEPRLMVFSAEAGEAMVADLKKQRQLEVLRRFEAIHAWNDEHNADLTDEIEVGKRIAEEVSKYRAEQRERAQNGHRS